MEDKRLENKIFDALTYNMVTYTEYFLTPNIYKKYKNKYKGLNIVLKGYDRKQIYFIPEIYEEYSEFDYICLKITVNNKFKEILHKDFLGSIMSFNIKREQIGDLFVKDNICYLYTNQKIAKYLIENLKEISNNNCIVEYSEEKNINYTFEEIEIISSSFRLDSIVKGITNLSREKASELINASLVMVDYEVCIKKDKIVNVSDIVTIRKYGKYKIIDYKETKKGKYKILFNKYK